jgi:trans-2,3-dihydro-3-hydroxyanthranilate isomerase
LKIELDKKQSGEVADHCKTAHQALLFFALCKFSSRMLCIEKNQLIEDAATKCKQLFASFSFNIILP